SQNCASFCLSNCGHIFCKECIDKGRLSVTCNRCRTASPKFVAIDRSLNPDLQAMFERPVSIVDKHSSELHPIIHFQDTQRTMRLKGQNALLKKEREKNGGLQSQLTIVRDEVKEMKNIQRQSRPQVR
ncbi:hypothetical protein PFISCL1PPCAC_2539, partial [Pristionchus fissidentatus]